MLAALTGLGLSAAAGLNAYIPFLAVALLARFTDVVTLPSALAWIESWPAIAVTSVLLLAEFFLDKVPVVDSVNDAIQTAVRPASAGVVVAATTAAEEFENSSAFFTENSWVPIALGAVVALIVHATKATVRPIANAGTGGVAAPVLSTAEDGFSVGLSLLALLAPVLALLVLVGLVWWFLATIRRARLRRAERREARAASRSDAGTVSTERPRPEWAPEPRRRREPGPGQP